MESVIFSVDSLNGTLGYCYRLVEHAATHQNLRYRWSSDKLTTGHMLSKKNSSTEHPLFFLRALNGIKEEKIQKTSHRFDQLLKLDALLPKRRDISSKHRLARFVIDVVEERKTKQSFLAVILTDRKNFLVSISLCRKGKFFLIDEMVGNR